MEEESKWGKVWSFAAQCTNSIPDLGLLRRKKKQSKITVFVEKNSAADVESEIAGVLQPMARPIPPSPKSGLTGEMPLKGTSSPNDNLGGTDEEE
jgi:hypothetical protein